MIKELANFTQSLDVELKEIGLQPREGLHIVLSVEELPDGDFQIAERFNYELFRKKKTDSSELQKKCAAWARAAWMVDTNKCFDTLTRAVHSASPYCLAIKRSSLKDGKSYVSRKKENKTLVYNSLDLYFDNAFEFLEDEKEQKLANTFRAALYSEEKIHSYLTKVDEIERVHKETDGNYQPNGYSQVKDDNMEYVIFYLDVPLEFYKKVNDKYWLDKVFNVNDYNYPKGKVTLLTQGLSSFFNRFPHEKPFLAHQTAPFIIGGRISTSEALRLQEFNELINRNIFPRPLPIFIYNDELQQHSFNLFKEEAVKEPAQRKTHAQIITELYSRHKDELGNYYLLYYQQGQIKDFDFVSKFEYHLADERGEPWSVKDWFGVGYAPVYDDVFKFQNNLLPVIFNNSLVVPPKSNKGGVVSFQLRFFEDIASKQCMSDNTHLLVMKYRQAFYDFIYKSKRQAVTQIMFEDILLTGILNDLRLDQYENRQHSEDANLRRKLNVLFSLHTCFQPHQINPIFMPNQLNELRPFMARLATGDATIETDGQFAFAAGQVIYYIQSKSKSEDRSYARLEPFLQQTDVKQFQQAILKLFDRYKHETFPRRFEEPMANVLSYTPQAQLKSLMPLMLAGFFSKNTMYESIVMKGDDLQASNE